MKECRPIAYCLPTKPWNQSGKLPLLRMSDTCVSMNQRSTSSFRPLSDASMPGSTSDCWFIRQALLFRGSLTWSPLHLALMLDSEKENEIAHLIISTFFYLDGLNGVIVPTDSCHLAPFVMLKASFYYLCSFFLQYTSRYYHFFNCCFEYFMWFDFPHTYTSSMLLFVFAFWS